MNLFGKSNFNCVFSSSLDWFHSSRLSEKVGTKKNIFCRETESFYALCLSHRRYLCYALTGLLPSRPRGRRGASTYNCSDNLGYIRGLNGKQKQLIKKLVHICMIDGKKTRSRAIVYKTFHRLAPHGDVIKLLVNAIENVKPICEVKKVRISGTTRLVPSIIATNRQETLAIRWMLESAAKRRMGKKSISLDQCLYAEILEASQKMGIARKKRDDLHKLAEANRSFSHYRWW
uniref:Ribosomal protein S7 n=1 Tax=Riccia fluitans TaxID=41844 RepID=A0A4Y5WXI1_9MARC|nr:ribosomal protein S7 [Riccia fluitans]QDE12687.1 ribosomal protein S7 [Riccia fluitans]QIB72381.1 ribosomal protein S7 [Riccia fluitans]WKW95132.1 ribosomal protein S7 [Riccia fluitans]